MIRQVHGHGAQPFPLGRSRVRGPLDDLTEMCKWENSGGPEGKASLVTAGARPGKHALRFEAQVEQSGPPPYPSGWPSCQVRLDPGRDWSAYDAIQFRVRTECTDPRLPFPISLIIHGAEMQQFLPLFTPCLRCRSVVGPYAVQGS